MSLLLSQPFKVEKEISPYSCARSNVWTLEGIFTCVNYYPEHAKVGIENLTVIATRNKLRSLKRLTVDTGDTTLDEELRGYIRVVVDYGEEHVVKVC